MQSPPLPPTKSEVSANHCERKGWKFFIRYLAFPSIAAYLLFSFLTPALVLSHAGHGDEFHSESEAATTAESIQVDAQTLKRMGIQVNPVVRQSLDVGIKTTGQIETLPSQQVEVTAPAAGKVVQLLVEPGDVVEKAQSIAVLSSHELTELRVNSLEKRAEAEGNIKEAEANLKLAKENYQLQLTIAEADITQAQTQLTAARAQYERDQSLVNEEALVKLAKEDYQRQLTIAQAEIAQADTELTVAQEQYDRDQELAESGALPRRQMLESQAHLAEAKAQVAKATSRLDVLKAQSEVKRAEADLPLREMRESQGKYAEAQALVTRAQQRRDVLEAEAEIKRAEAALEVAKSRLQLSSTTYETRLKQMGTAANEEGLVTVSAPISGTIAHREITLGQSIDAAGQPLMTILNDSRVWATANIYEKDLDLVKTGQQVRVKVASLPNRTFIGRIAVIGAVVDGETRVVPVKAELENAGGQLKPGMFAQLEVLTDKTAAALVVIPASAVVEGNGKSLVYVQNGENFEPVEVTLGQTSGDLVEVKTGIFEGDRIVTQGAIGLYAQSLRGGSKGAGKQKSEDAPAQQLMLNPSSLPGWWAIPASVVIAAGAFWMGRRTQSRRGVTELPASDIGDFEDLPVLAENNHHHPSVAGKE